jgi:RNA polymerase sigma-70 factor, ECF subfamily
MGTAAGTAGLLNHLGEYAILGGTMSSPESKPLTSTIVREDEPALVAAARGGDLKAFEELVSRYERKIFRLAMNITGNREDAEDVMQEAFLKSYSHLQEFQGDSRFYTWLVRIAVNEALMKLRKRRPGQVSLDDPGEPGEESFPQEVRDWGPSPEQHFAQTELAGILSEAIEKLEPGYRMVFVLRDIEELSTEDVAGLLSLSEAAVKSRLLRARLKLRDILHRTFGKGEPN